MKVSALVLACALVPLSAAAQPTISSTAGSLINNNAVTVNGSGFGTKTTAAPQKYDDFSSGTPGANIGNGWTLVRNGVGGAGVFPTYTSARLRHARDTRSARANFAYTSASNYTYLSSFGLSDQTWIPNGLYIDTWMYLDYGGTDGADYSRNHKLIRIHAGSEAFPNLYLAYWNPLYAGNSIVDQDSLENTSFSAKTTGISGWDANDFENHWVHIQMYLVQSTTSTANGRLWVRLNGSTVINRTNVVNRDTSAQGNNPWAQVLFGNYMGHDSCCGGNPPEQGPAFPYTGLTDWSDVYVDSTPQRVEVCDNANYNSTTHCEIQVPTAWSNTSVSFTAKQGSFAGSDSAFLFVCNASNVCNTNGFPISYGGTLPSKVTNLRVVPGSEFD